MRLFIGENGHDDRKLHLLGMASAMAGVGYWFYSPVDGRVSWSGQVYAIYGVSPESFDPNLDQAISFFHPEDRPVLEACLKRAVEE
ncbi:MAG: PAS domain-containing protein, partial [Pseudomonadota bacterium]|nr:PAS domain-containing protein [Pseudomonadota bacterium]